MNNSELRVSFLNWLEQRRSLDFLSDKYLSASLNQAIELTQNSTINGVSVVKTMPFENICSKIIKYWQSHSLSLLKPNPLSVVQLKVFDVEVPTSNIDVYRNELETLFSQLMSECSE